jgi:isopenicillin N synthase-like dioxygenase
MADDQFLPKLPVIDFSMENLKSGTSSWFSKCNNVKSAFEEYGCFVAVYDKVSLELHNSMFGTLEGLFDLPKDTKIRNTYDKPYFGYVREEPSKIVPESMGIDDATTLEGTQYFSNLMWPSGNHHFRYFLSDLLSHIHLINLFHKFI